MPKIQIYIFSFPERNIALKSTGSCETDNKNLGLELLLGGAIGSTIEAGVSAKEVAEKIEREAQKHYDDCKLTNCD